MCQTVLASVRQMSCHVMLKLLLNVCVFCVRVRECVCGLQRSQVSLDEDEEDAHFSQITSSQVQRARENFTSDQIDRKVPNIICDIQFCLS